MDRSLGAKRPNLGPLRPLIIGLLPLITGLTPLITRLITPAKALASAAAIQVPNGCRISLGG